MVALLESNAPLRVWYERAAANLQLDTIFSMLDASVAAEIKMEDGWRLVLDPFSSNGEELFARVAVDERAGVPLGTIDSRLREERMGLLEFLRWRHELASLDAAAHALSELSDCPLPADVRDRWSSAYWCEVGHRVVRLLEENPCSTGVVEALLQHEAIRALAELSTCECARFEVLLLRLRRAGLKSEASALRRVVRDEVAKRRALQRQLLRRIDDETNCRSVDEIITRFLDALATFLHENAHRFWRGPQDRRARRDLADTWIGRQDSPDAPIAIAAEYMRGLLAIHGDAEELLTALGDRGLLTSAPGGGFRWQRRVGPHGDRMSCIAISPLVISGRATHPDRSDRDVTA